MRETRGSLLIDGNSIGWNSLEIECDSVTEDTLTFTVTGVPMYGTGDEPVAGHIVFPYGLIADDIQDTYISAVSDNGDLFFNISEIPADVTVAISGSIEGDPGEETDGTLILTIQDTGYTWDNRDGYVNPGWFHINGNGSFTNASLNAAKNELTLSYESQGEDQRHDKIVVYATGNILDEDSEYITGTIDVCDANARWNIGDLSYYFDGFDSDAFSLWKGQSKGTEEQRRFGNENIVYTEASGGGYETEYWFLSLNPERTDKLFRAILIENYENGMTLVKPEDRCIRTQDGWVIEIDPNRFPAGFKMSICDEWRPLDGQFRILYSRGYQTEAVVSYQWEKGGQSGSEIRTDSQGNPGGDFEPGAKQYFTVTPPDPEEPGAGFYGAVQKELPMYGNEESHEFLTGQSSKIVDNQDGTWTLKLYEEDERDEDDWTGYDLELFWSQDEYEWYMLPGTNNWDESFIIDSWTNGNGSIEITSDVGGDESHSRGDGTRYRMSNEAEELTFTVNTPAGIDFSIWVNGQEYRAEDLDVNRQFTYERPQEGWQGWLSVNADFREGEAVRVFDINDFCITGEEGEPIDNQELILTIPEEADWKWSNELDEGDDVTGQVWLNQSWEQETLSFTVTSVDQDRKVLTLSVNGTAEAGWRRNIYVGTRGIIKYIDGQTEIPYAAEVGSNNNDNAYWNVDVRRWITLRAVVDGTETDTYTITPGIDGRATGVYKLTLPADGNRRFTADAVPDLCMHQESWTEITVLQRPDEYTMFLQLSCTHPYGEDDAVQFNFENCVEEYTEGPGGGWHTLSRVRNIMEEGLRISIPVAEKLRIGDLVVYGRPGEDIDFTLMLLNPEDEGLYWSENVLNRYSLEQLKEHIYLNIEQEWYQFTGWEINQFGHLLVNVRVNAQEGRGHRIRVEVQELAAASADATEAVEGKFATPVRDNVLWNITNERFDDCLEISDTEITGIAGGTYEARMTVSIADAYADWLQFDQDLFTYFIDSIVEIDTHGCDYEIEWDRDTLTDRSIDLTVTGTMDHVRTGDQIYLEFHGGLRNRNNGEPQNGCFVSRGNSRATWNISGVPLVTVTSGTGISGTTLTDLPEQEFSFTLPEGYSWPEDIEQRIEDHVIGFHIGTNTQSFEYVSCENGVLTVEAGANVPWQNADSIVFEFWYCIIDPDSELIEHQVLSFENPSIRWNITSGGRLSLGDVTVSGRKDEDIENVELVLTLDENSGLLWDPDMPEAERLNEYISLENMNCRYWFESYHLDQTGRELTVTGTVHPYDSGTREISVYVDNLFVRANDTNVKLEGHLSADTNEDARWNIREDGQQFTLSEVEAPLYTGDSRIYTVDANGYSGDYSVEWYLRGEEGFISLDTDTGDSVTVSALEYNGGWFRLETKVTYGEGEDSREEWIGARITLAPSFRVTGDGEIMLNLPEDETMVLSVEEIRDDVTLTSVAWESGDEEIVSLNSSSGDTVILTGEEADPDAVYINADITYTRNSETYHERRYIPVLVYSGTVPQFTVTYDAGGGTGYVAPQNFTAGNSVQLSMIGFTKSGWRALYWEDTQTHDRYTPGEYCSFVTNVTLVPQWYQSGWVQEEGIWKYYYDDGNMARWNWIEGEAGRPWADSEGKLYFVDGDGNLASDVRIDWEGEVYLTDSTGSMIMNGWGIAAFEDDGKSYWKTMYLGSEGKAYRDRYAVISGIRYRFNEDAYTVPDYEISLMETPESEEPFGMIELNYGNPAGIELFEPENPAVRFYGWYTAPAGGVRISDLSQVRSDLTLYPRGETVSTAEYTVQHRLQNLNTRSSYDLETSETLTGRVGEMTQAEAKAFDGFTAQAFSQTEIAQNGTTVVIRYNRNAYTVSFDVSGTELPAQETISGVYGETISIPSPQAPSGKVFMGWYEGTQRVGSTVVLTHDMTLVPHFASDGWQFDGAGWKYYISGFARGEGWLGLPIGNPVDWYYIDGNGYMVQNQLIRYNWEYYYLGADGKRAKDEFVRLPATEDDTWTGLSERIYYFGPTGKAKKDAVVTIDGNTYYFDGEAKAAVGFTNWKFNIKNYDNAAYDAEYYFDENGVMAKDSFLTFEVPYREEYSYLSGIWFYFNEEGRKQRQNRRINGLQYCFDQDTGVVTSGKRIIFDPNCEIGEYEEYVRDITAFPGAKITIPDTGFEREGYIFRGWQDASGIFYAPGSTYTVVNTRPAILTAQWEAKLWDVDTSQCENATVSFAGSEPRTRETLTITVNPEEDYGTVSVEAWALNFDGSVDHRLQLNTVTAGKSYTLTMPACPIRIKAVAELMYIKGNPEDQFLKVGKTAEFAVYTVGENLSYRWQEKPAGGSWTNASGSGVNTSVLQVPVTAAKANYQYRCIVSNRAGYAMVTSAAVLSIKPVIKITAQPAAQAAKSGKTVTFKVTATGDKLTYQWQSSGNGTTWTNVSSGTGASLAVAVSPVNNGYQYRCIISDSDSDKLTSSAANLTMKAALKITAQPAAQAAKSGRTVTFKVTATGDKLTYQWQSSKDGKNWVSVSGTAAKKASLAVIVSSSNNGYQYRCVITDSDKDTLTTAAVKLTMKAALKITVQPAAQAAKSGKTVTFKVTATGDKLIYQWQSSKDGKKWTNISGTAAKKASYAVKVSKTNNGYQYRCVITDSDKDTLTSKAAKLTMKAELKITSQPAAQSAKVNKSVTFTVKATGDKLTYQWQSSKDGKKWTNVSGSAAKKASLSVKVTKSNNGYQYRCVITDSDKAKVTSKAVKLTLKK